jgi:hypothetical protein
MSSKSVGCKEAFNAGIRSGETEAAPVIRELIESVTVRRRSEGVEVVIKGRLTTPILRAWVSRLAGQPYYTNFATRILINGLAAISLDIIVGYGGMVSGKASSPRSAF